LYRTPPRTLCQWHRPPNDRQRTGWLGAAMAGILVTGCVTSPHAHEDGPGHRASRDFAGGDQPVLGGADAPTPRSSGLNVFISPMGEPFRAGRGEPYPVVRWFERVNTSHTGEVTEAEFVTDADRFFDALDTNHDGVIDGFELNDYERNVAPEIQPHIRGLRAGEGMDPDLRFDEHEGQPAPRGRGRGGGGGGREGGPGQGRELAGDLARQGAAIYALLPDPEPVASASSSLNGRITRGEWREAAVRRFQRLLPAGRMTLTLQALPKTPVQLVLEQRKAPHGN
jgi:hypothetical protein